MPDRGLMSVCVALSLALMIPVAFAPACATAQSGDDQAIQSAAKRGVYRDLSANESRMAATRQDKAQIAAAIARDNALLARASPAVRTWVWDEARQQSRELHTDQPAAAAARNRFGNNLSTADVDALVQLVMMQAARNAEQELSDALAQMQAINQQKKAQRDAARMMHDNQSAMRATMRAETVHGPLRTSRVELAAYVARASDGEDSLDDMSEEQQLKMQMVMDRMQKALEMASNLMKKESDTSDSIIGNLK